MAATQWRVPVAAARCAVHHWRLAQHTAAAAAAVHAPWRRVPAAAVATAAHEIPLAAAPAALPPRFRDVTPPGGAGVGRRVDELLRQGEAAAPLARLHVWARKGMVRVVAGDGSRAAPLSRTLTHRLRHDDRIVAHDSIAPQVDAARGHARTTPPPPSPPLLPSPPPAWVAHAVRWVSPHVAVISKPAGVATQGGSGVAARHVVDTWLPAIAASLPPPPPPPSPLLQHDHHHPPAERALRLVHRLDRDVGGLLLLARSRVAADACRVALASRDGGIRKCYVAVVAAPLPPRLPAAGVIHEPVRATDAGADAGVDALSRYAALPAGAAGTLLLLAPITGRKHQLRQHVLHLFDRAAGIVGDRKYAGSAGGGAGGARLLLHAVHLRLTPAVTGAPAVVDVFDTPPPPFAPALAAAGVGTAAALRAALLRFVDS